MAFVDLTKAFDLVNRKALFQVLKKSGCPPTLLSLTESFHKNMMGSVRYEGGNSPPFHHQKWGETGMCTRSDTLWNLLLYRTERSLQTSLSNQWDYSNNTKRWGNSSASHGSRRKRKSPASTSLSCYMLMMPHSAHAQKCDLQNMLDTFKQCCSNFGLTISLKKTVTMSQGQDPTEPFNIAGTELERVHKFTYLGSTMSDSLSLTDELSTRIGKASSTFGRLTDHVWVNRHLSIRTRVRVYEAWVLSILLYGAETWLTYRHQERRLNSFHMRCLRTILDITWKDKVTNQFVLGQTNTRPLHTTLKLTHLWWCGHVARMSDQRTPAAIFFGELSSGSRPVGRPLLRFKDVIKRDLQDFGIATDSWVRLCQDRTEWRARLLQGTKRDAETTNTEMARRRTNPTRDNHN